MAERVLRGQQTFWESCMLELPVNTEFWRDRNKLAVLWVDGGVGNSGAGCSRQPAVTLYLDSEVRCCKKKCNCKGKFSYDL